MLTVSELSNSDLDLIRSKAVIFEFNPNDCIFNEGDEAEYVYFIETGRVSIFFQKFTATDEIHTLGPGQYFGEMALLMGEKRNASAHAVEDTKLLCLDKGGFDELLQQSSVISEKVNKIVSDRNEELILRETLISSAGIDANHLHVSIKGDPSLRETALFRERYESAVDKYLPDLIPALEDLLINRCVYQVYIGCNSGEIRTISLLNPYCEEIHQIRKLLDESYRHRHFPVMEYSQKAELIKQLYSGLKFSKWFQALPGYLHKIWGTYYDDWKPVTPEEIVKTIRNLPVLRSIENYYLRNITFSIVRDAIHMQFNCDGTHIVSTGDYQRFLDENI